MGGETLIVKGSGQLGKLGPSFLVAGTDHTQTAKLYNLIVKRE